MLRPGSAIKRKIKAPPTAIAATQVSYPNIMFLNFDQ